MQRSNESRLQTRNNVPFFQMEGAMECGLFFVDGRCKMLIGFFEGGDGKATVSLSCGWKVVCAGVFCNYRLASGYGGLLL